MDCPLCGGTMYPLGDYEVCANDKHHAIHSYKELSPYYGGVRDIVWLRWRMKVRVGKKLQAERRMEHAR